MESSNIKKVDTENHLEEIKLKNTIEEIENPEPAVFKTHFFSGPTGIMSMIVVGFAILLLLLHNRYLPIPEEYIGTIGKVVFATILILLVLIFSNVIKKIVIKKSKDKSTIYNFRQIINLFALILIIVIVLSFLFANWYAALVSFGVVSVILGLALQNPISSFFGWIYILIRKPYEVGDRIKIGTAFGDVIRVSYIDTTLWECRGDYLSSDHPSGRIIKFANSKVFSEYVFNYSWAIFPYIWNEVRILVSHDSDFKFVRDTMRKIAEEELGESMLRRIKRYKKILATTPVDELEVTETPSTLMRVHDNGWIEISVRFLVNPKNSSGVKKVLLERIITTLRQSPDKVRFPANP